MKRAHNNINNRIPLFALYALGVRLSGMTPTPKTRYQVLTNINQVDPFILTVTPGNLYKILDKMIDCNLIEYGQTNNNQEVGTLVVPQKASAAYYTREVNLWAQTEFIPANIPALLTLLSSENDIELIRPIFKMIKINLISDQERLARILDGAKSVPYSGGKYWAPKTYRQKSVQACLETVLEFEHHLIGSKN